MSLQIQHRSTTDSEKPEKSERLDSEYSHTDDVSSEDLDVVPQSRGVAHIEAVRDTMRHAKSGTKVKVLLCASILICCWVQALDSSTTYAYEPFATSSFGKHSMLGTVTIARTIIASICRPILAKIADLTSRPHTYILVVTLYTVGYVISAAAQDITAFSAGQVLAGIGSAGIDLVSSLIVADLTPLKWRGLLTSFLSTPYIINTWFAGLISDAIVKRNWRWGYGMFAIMIPVVISPAIAVLLWLDHRAQKHKKLAIASEKLHENIKPVAKKKWINVVWEAIVEIDLLGLLLLGFGFSLLLLPFSLANGASKGWKNPSLIAMMIVGGLLLIAYGVYESLYAPVPSMPKRVLFNKTFFMSVCIDFVYLLAGNIGGLYFASYVYVVTDLSTRDWTYYNNTMTMALCCFGVVAGVIMRVTHRYRDMQIAGLAVKIIGYGIIIRSKGAVPNLASLVMNRILVGTGGALSVVASQVAAQASVAHQDLALSISLLSLWSNMGGAIGAAVASAMWQRDLPGFLAEFLPADSKNLAPTLFGSFAAIKEYPELSPIRQAGIKSYSYAIHDPFVITLSLSFIPLICAFFQTNYFLGDTLNKVEVTKQEETEDEKPENEEPKTRLDKVAAFFNKKMV